MQISLTPPQRQTQEYPIKYEPLLYAKRESVKSLRSPNVPAHNLTGTKTCTEVYTENVDAD